MATILQSPTCRPVSLAPSSDDVVAVGKHAIMPWTASNASNESVGSTCQQYTTCLQFPHDPTERLWFDFPPHIAFASGQAPEQIQQARLMVNEPAPMLAWQDVGENDADDLASNNTLACPESIEDAARSQWVVVYTCDVGDNCVGEPFNVQIGDAWACFGNVMLAKRREQLVLCRHTPFLQMLNFQVFSDGQYVERNRFWCPPENSCIPLDHEQAFMDVLAGCLQFMLASASALATKFRLHNSTSDMGHSPIIATWQTSCPQTNRWACATAANMWDMVHNGCLMREEVALQLLEDEHGRQSTSFPSHERPAFLALPDCMPDEESEVIVEGRQDLDILRMQERRVLAIEDGEPDEEAETIEQAKYTQEDKVRCLLEEPQFCYEESKIVEQAKCTQEAKVRCLLNETRAEVIPAKPTTSKASVRPHRRSSKPDKVQSSSHHTRGLVLGDEESDEVRVTPARPSTSNSSRRPHRRPSRADNMQSSSFPTYNIAMDDEGLCRQRDSSLVRGYDALDSNFPARTKGNSMSSIGNLLNANIFSKGESAMDRESSLARNYDALDNFDAPSQLPPLRCISQKRPSSPASSRPFSSALDSRVIARSAMAVDLGEDVMSRPPTRHENRPLSSSSSGMLEQSTSRSLSGGLQQSASSPTLSRSRSFARHRSAIAAASSMGSSVDAPKAQDSRGDVTSRAAPYALRSEGDLTSRALPVNTKPYALGKEGLVLKAAPAFSLGRMSSSKLPPLLPDKKSAHAGVWSVPTTANRYPQHNADGPLLGRRAAQTVAR